MIVSFLKRLKANTPTEPRQRTARDLQGIPQLEKKDYSKVDHSQKDRSPKQTRLEQQYTELKQAAEFSQPSVKLEPKKDKQETSLNKMESKKTNVIKDQKVNHPSFTPSNQDIIDGVIWAEILGPPRALNPHSPRRLTRR